MNRVIHSRIYWSILLSIPVGMAGMLRWPFPDENALLQLILLEKPVLFFALKYAYLVMLFTTPFIGFSVALSSFYIFVARREKRADPIRLPAYPPEIDRSELYLIIGEVHHPKKSEPVENPRWLVIPDRGLFTGIAVFGAIGTGKTTGCMYPFAKQLLAEQPLKDIIMLMRDTGMRNGRELYRMRIENIDWNDRVIFNPNSKTKKGRRFIPMSDRVLDILLVRCAGGKEGWVFPSRQKGKHITCGLVNKQWVRARTKAGLPEGLVLYCARHDFGTYVLQQTGNIAAVMNTMGHSDMKTAMVYQHPELNVVREAINARSLAENSGHVLGHRSERPN